VKLLLLIYALIAGLAGVNTGPSAFARTAQVADGASSASMTRLQQVALTAQAMVARAASPNIVPIARSVDARKLASPLLIQQFGAPIRVAVERRRE
jgi:hypothetical protein